MRRRRDLSRHIKGWERKIKPKRKGKKQKQKRNKKLKKEISRVIMITYNQANENLQVSLNDMYFYTERYFTR